MGERRSREALLEEAIKKRKSKEASRIALLRHEKTTYVIKQKALELADQKKAEHPEWSTRKIAMEIFQDVHAIAKRNGIPFMCAGPTERPFYQNWLLPHFREKSKSK